MTTRTFAGASRIEASSRSEQPGGWVLLADPGTTPLPGYPLGHVAPEDVHARVQSHRAAFAPSDLTVEMHSKVSTAQGLYQHVIPGMQQEATVAFGPYRQRSPIVMPTRRAPGTRGRRNPENEENRLEEAAFEVERWLRG